MQTEYKTILFIEDEKFIADLYAEVLRNHGYTVECAYDGAQGLQLAQTKRYDLVLLDLMLPGVSGESILTTLRDKAASPSFDQSTAIFVFTNFEEDNATKSRLTALAQKYLMKINITPLALVELLKAGPSTDAAFDSPAQG